MKVNGVQSPDSTMAGDEWRLRLASPRRPLRVEEQGGKARLMRAASAAIPCDDR